MQYAVDIIKMESISLIQAKRQMPLLMEQFKRDSNWIVFEKPLKVYDNTVPNMIAILSGGE